MYVQDKGLKYDKESVLNRLLNLNSFKAATKGKDPEQIRDIAEMVTEQIVLLTQCITLEAATKTTTVFLTVCKDTKQSTGYHLNYVFPGRGASRFHIPEACLELYGARKVKTGKSYVICFYTSVVGMSHSLAATDKFFRLVQSLTGVYCQCPTIL